MYKVSELEMTPAAVKWAVRQGRFRKVEYGIYAEGPEPLSALDRARGAVLATGGVASGCLAGVLLGMDAVRFREVDVTVPPSGNGHRRGVRRRVLPDGADRGGGWGSVYGWIADAPRLGAGAR